MIGLDVSALSFHKVMQAAWNLDAMNEWGSIVGLSYIAAQRVFHTYNDMADNKAVLESIARSFGYHFGNRNIELASCIELIHMASILHDDVVDDSKLRRGKSTANNLWGNKSSILVGDYLFSKSFQIMVKIAQFSSKPLRFRKILRKIVKQHLATFCFLVCIYDTMFFFSVSSTTVRRA